MTHFRALLLAGMVWMSLALPVAGQSSWTWYTVDADRNVRLQLYVFWTQKCSRCADALTFTSWLQRRYPWLDVRTYEVSRHPANRDLYQRMAQAVGQRGGQVPAFVYCNRLLIGYDSYQSHGRRIEQGVVGCYQGICTYLKEQDRRKTEDSAGLAWLLITSTTCALASTSAPPPPLPDLPPIDLPPANDTMFRVPGWGEVDASALSLPTLTLVLGACDAFNPCAFFVLLTLLGLLVHTHSRMRMLLVGGTFVFFSGLLYFLFMAAWLNLFFLLGHMAMVTTVAGLIAVAVALVNVKDYFWFKRGVTLSIPDQARPRLYRRMTGLLNEAGLVSLLLGTATLAAAANLYELLCTSGFPMVYTRVLTLHPLSPFTYYLYLLAYNLVYVLPLAVIVLAFALTLGSHKLSEREGRLLKLLSGLMMLALGLALLVYPSLLHSVVGAIALLAVALIATGLILLIERVARWWRGPQRPSGPSHSIPRQVQPQQQSSSTCGVC